MFTIVGMGVHQHKIKLPLTISASSLVFIIFLTLFTNPINNTVWAIQFFLLLFVFLTTLTSSLLILQRGEASSKAKRRIILGVSFLIICFMLRSTGSLNLIDVLVLTLIFAGSIFYFSYRR